MGVMGAGFVVGVRMVAEWFPPKEIGMAQGIYGGWGNFGDSASQLLLPSFGVLTATWFGSEGNVNWRLAISAIGVVCAFYGLVSCETYFSEKNHLSCRWLPTDSLTAR